MDGQGYPTTTVYFVGVAMNKPIARRRREPADPRQALYMAADREAIINIVNEGVSRPVRPIVPVGIPGYRAGTNPYTYRPRQGAGQAR